MSETRINISSMQDFMQCRFRWWCKWVKNRVPVATAPALDGGKLLHNIFEEHFLNGTPLLDASVRIRAEYAKKIPLAHPAAQPGAWKALTVIEDMEESFPLWHDEFPIQEVLEIEEPFEMLDKNDNTLIWLGRPDRVVIAFDRLWHIQNRGLAAGMNFGTYIRLAKRHYHEHLYGEWLSKKYKKRAKYGGTIFNLVRKLKYRTNAGKKNEKVKTAEEMFWQKATAYSMTDGHHQSVMAAIRQHAEQMREVMYKWERFGVIPAPNEKMNGGYSGSSEDPYFKLLIGEVKLSDDSIFKDREDTYAITETEE